MCTRRDGIPAHRGTEAAGNHSAQTGRKVSAISAIATVLCGHEGGTLETYKLRIQLYIVFSYMARKKSKRYPRHLSMATWLPTCTWRCARGATRPSCARASTGPPPQSCAQRRPGESAPGFAAAPDWKKAVNGSTCGMGGRSLVGGWSSGSRRRSLRWA